jgi:hypothetical protein
LVGDHDLVDGDEKSGEGEGGDSDVPSGIPHDMCLLLSDINDGISVGGRGGVDGVIGVC